MGCSNRIAKLEPHEIEAVQALEQSLGNRFCLLAVEKGNKLFVLEAKIAPNTWERVDKVYPEIEGLKSYYCSEEDAHLAKASLKSLLQGRFKLKFQKRPIRIRHIV